MLLFRLYQQKRYGTILDNTRINDYSYPIETFCCMLQKLSFRTGVVVLAMCIPCYIASFAQAVFPISMEMKGVLWVIFFGLAKAFQYCGLAILGVDGYKRLKAKFRKV